MTSVRISGIGVYLPSGRLTAEQASAATGVPVEMRRAKLGISQVCLADPSETASSMATNAIAALRREIHLDLESVEFLILVTQNPDSLIPTTACVVQQKAGLPRNMLAYDENQGCSGFVIALGQAKAFIESGMFKRGLIVTSELYNRVIRAGDKNTYGLFGDAACAVCVEATNEDRGVGNFFFGSDGSRSEDLSLRGGPEGGLYMNGRAIFEFACRTIPTEINTFLTKQNLSVSDIDHWILHQANRYMNERLLSEVGIPKDRAFFDIDDIGNTVSNSIPIALKRALATKAITGNKIMIVGFGVGLSWAGCLYRLGPDSTL